jgi:hypothetical protein
MLGLGVVKVALQITDNAANGAVADRLALEGGRYSGDERISVSRVEGGGGVGNGEKLRLA